jgi:hypothetical protein
MSKPSRFDPLDMALKSLAPSQTEEGGTAGEPLPEESPAQTGPSITVQPVIPSDTSNQSSAAQPSQSSRKTQLNVYVRAEVADHLRRAVLDLGQRLSLGDLVALLVTEHLDETVGRLAADDPSESVRLRGGRKVRQR